MGKISLLLQAIAWPIAGLLFLGHYLSGAAAIPPHLGYGFNVAFLNTGQLQTMGFDWIKVFSDPGTRLPQHVLWRIPAAASDMNDLTAFGNGVYQMALGAAGNVEAFEIGNEVNLDADYGWGAPPIAADYVQLLCVAYANIKLASPNALVVSAGLAPTGRVSGNWNGHAGHNGLYQDEREYLREWIAAGGGNCVDAVGYHPYGFSADYNAEPDLPSADPTQNCTNGFCFRGAEKFYEILSQNNLGHKPVWATETGWIVYPPDDCLSHPSFQGRHWQLVTEEKQASNLVGAFTYADANWSWMGPIFIFNLDFNQAPWLEDCDQMRYYSVMGRPAETALTNMPKNPGSLVGQLELLSAPWLLMAVDEQPFTATVQIGIANAGWQAFTYTATVVTGTALSPSLLVTPTGVLAPAGITYLPLSIPSDLRPSGLYTGLVTIITSNGVVGAPVTVPITLYLADEVHRTYLPITQRP